MRTLTTREKRTISIAGAAVAVYLLLFFGAGAGKSLQKRRADYDQLADEARLIQERARLYEDKAAEVRRLMETYHLDPAKLSRASVVAEASAAIQKAAAGERVQIGPIRETPARATAKELATMELELSGPVQSVMSLLHRLDTLGYPLVIDTIQIDGQSAGGGSGMPPGMMISGLPPGVSLPAGIRMGGPGGGGMAGMGGPPGNLKLKLTIVILDFEKWKKEEKRNA